MIISGSAFVGATEVDFGSTSATSFVVKSQNTIKAIAPPGTGTVDVTVTTPEGTSPTSSADQFSYVASPPTVEKVSPAEAAREGWDEDRNQRDQLHRRHRSPFWFGARNALSR